MVQTSHALLPKSTWVAMAGLYYLSIKKGHEAASRTHLVGNVFVRSV